MQKQRIKTPYNIGTDPEFRREAALAKLSENLIRSHDRFVSELKQFYKKVEGINQSPKVTVHGHPIDEQALFKKLVDQIPPPIHGKSPKLEDIVAEVINQLPKPKAVKIPTQKLPNLKIPELPKTEDIVALVVEEIKKGKIKKEHIDGLEQDIQNINHNLGTKYLHGGGDTIAAGTNVTITDVNGRKVINASGSGGSGNYSDAETPSGSGTTFTLAHTPSPAASLQLYRNGQLQKAGGTDFTLSGANITLGTTFDAVNEILTAWYRY